MPLYVYQCPCGNKFEKLCPSDTPQSQCPQCGGNAERIPAPINWSFGWRLTEASHERFSEDEWEKDV